MSCLKNEAEHFLEFAEGTRNDFHEPDEQDIRLESIVGTNLDNAFGNEIYPQMLENGAHEVVVICSKDHKPYKFNLATIFALAKEGAKNLTT